MNSMDNSTVLPENGSSLNSPGFMIYCILLAVLTVVAGIMLGFTVVSLLMATSLPRPVRLFLINLLVGGLLVVVIMMFILGTSIALIGESAQLPAPRYLCRVYLWVFGIGGVARLWSLAAFSFAILGIVKFGKKTISLWSAAVVIAILWLVPMFLSLYLLLPYVFEAQFFDGVACFPDRNNVIIVEARYTFLLTWSFLGGIIPLIVSIIVPIVCLCYIKRHMVSEGTQYRKGMAKFSLFLVVGGCINVAGQALPALLSLSLAAPGIYLSYGCAVLSLLPTPIIILAYLKPVQVQAKKIVTFGQMLEGSFQRRMTTTTDATPSTDEKI